MHSASGRGGAGFIDAFCLSISVIINRFIYTIEYANAIFNTKNA
jgi:hypothetical protein